MSESRSVWEIWFERVGKVADANVVNATAELVIAERDLHAAPYEVEVRRLMANESALLSAIEMACHCWNSTPADGRTPLMQEAMNKLTGAHQTALRGTPKV